MILTAEEIHLRDRSQDANSKNLNDSKPNFELELHLTSSLSSKGHY